MRSEESRGWGRGGAMMGASDTQPPHCDPPLRCAAALQHPQIAAFSHEVSCVFTGVTVFSLSPEAPAHVAKGLEQCFLAMFCLCGASLRFSCCPSVVLSFSCSLMFARCDVTKGTEHHLSRGRTSEVSLPLGLNASYLSLLMI